MAESGATVCVHVHVTVQDLMLISRKKESLA